MSRSEAASAARRKAEVKIARAADFGRITSEAAKEGASRNTVSTWHGMSKNGAWRRHLASCFVCNQAK